MIRLGIAISHNCSASLMINGEIVGLIQEERLTKLKNQAGFPLLSCKALIAQHLDNDFNLIDEIVYGSKVFHPYGYCINLSSNDNIQDHINEMHNVWYPVFYENKKLDGEIWKTQYFEKKNLNNFHNFNFDFITKDISLDKATEYFSNIEVFSPIKKILPDFVNFKKIDHHKCHAYYALYGGNLNKKLFKNTLVLTADSMGDKKNWSVSIVNNDGTINILASGDEFLVARIYKFCTLILGMKPNEHEYKVMGLSAYSKSNKHIAAVESILFNILDFNNGKFVNKMPLKDSYFDLKTRLEGHRFDNIAAGLQGWTSKVLLKWTDYWLEKTKKTVVCFSGGLSMNIKANGDLLKSKNIKYLSVPASGGDETLSAGACFASALEDYKKVKPITNPHLGEKAVLNKNLEYIKDLLNNDLGIIENFDKKKIALLLSKNHVIARCVGRSEYGARALGNRSIIANPSDANNVKKINESIKNRDFWMPFTPSILEEYSDLFLENPKSIFSPYMTIGFNTVKKNRHLIQACLHMGDNSARPQFVSKKLNQEYWDLINEFYKLTKIPCLLNTSLNLHGEPMNYSIKDAIRTLLNSSLNFLILPNNSLLYKKEFKEFILNI